MDLLHKFPFVDRFNTNMWILQNQKNNCKYYLPCNKTITTGRKDADIVISGDTSVSREHATILISISASDVTKLNSFGKIVLTDVSKFGTYIVRQRQKSKVEQNMELRDGDLIEFGRQGSIFKLVHEHFNIAVSMVDDTVKSRLLEALVTIGGTMLQGWHHGVDYLVVKSIKLNLKVVNALVTPCHIVSCEFVLNIRDQVWNGFDQVVFEPEKYLPKFAEPSLSPQNCNFHVDLRRKKLFSDVTFVFLTEKQRETMGSIIIAGGGQVIQLTDDVGLANVSVKNTCFVAYQKSGIQACDLSHHKIVEIQKSVKAANKRLIEEYEIGLAVLYCDASVYCNPEFDLNSQNALTQKMLPQNLHSLKEVSSLTKDSCGLTKIEASDCYSNTSRLAEHQLDCESNSLISSDEAKTVANTSKIARPMLNIKNESDDNQSLPTCHIEDTGTLENAVDFESSECLTSSIKTGEIKGDAITTNTVPQPTVDADMFVDVAVKTAPENLVQLCVKRKRQIIEETVLQSNNFKKFRKVWPTYMNMPDAMQNSIEAYPRLPKVIGDNDFFVSCGYHESMSQGEFSSQQQDSNPFRRE